MAGDIWADDLLDRGEDARFLATFLRNRAEEIVNSGAQKSYVLNLDAGWGRGKTFFLERMRRELIEAGHVAVYVNAWQDDFADDPLIAVMAAIDGELSQYIEPRSRAEKTWNVIQSSAGKVAGQLAKGLALRALSLAVTEGVAKAIEATAIDAISSEKRAEGIGADVGKDVKAIVEKAGEKKAASAIADFRDLKESVSTFKYNLSNFLERTEVKHGKARPCFILVDELDRCRPAYAISMLERIKHLFDVPALSFIIATDGAQLAHAIGAVYGAGFDSRMYLKRFFDSSFVFERPPIEQFIRSLLSQEHISLEKVRAPHKKDPFELLCEFYEQFDTDLRTIKRNISTLGIIIENWSSPVPIELVVILPLILSFYRDTDAFKDLRSLQNSLSFPEGTSWTFTTLHYNDGPYPKEVTHDLARLPLEIFSTLGRDIFSLVKDNNKTYAGSIASEEVQKRFHGQMRDGEKPRSLVCSYPDLVMRAGRLKVG